MNDFFFDNFTKAPKGKKAVANQIGFCLITVIVILFVVSRLVTSVYLSALQSQRKTALMSFASQSSVALSHMTLADGMQFPYDCPKYDGDKQYIANVYVKAGNSFLRVYTSDKSYDETKQYVLTGAGDEYTEAFEQQQLIVTRRTSEDVAYVTSVAPIIGTDGTVSGIVEIMEPKADFEATVNGMSLSWTFTMISISVAIAIVYKEMHSLLDTLMKQPDKTVPRAVMYGPSPFHLIAFFSAIGCSMPLIVLASYLKDSLKEFFDSNALIHVWIILAVLMFLFGFWRFVHLRDLLIKRLTARIALLVSVVSAFVLLLLCGVINVPFLTIAFQLPIGFFLGMLFQFQREYRLHASRTGQAEYSERKVHQIQYSGYLLGAAVGAVIAGILYERFGLFTVLMVASFFLFVDAIQVLYFVKHCPPSNEPVVRLPNFFYALKNSKSGTFAWSTVFPLGVQFSFFLVFVPDFLEKVQISLATLAFYYMVSIVCSQVIMKLLTIWFEDFFTSRTRITLSAVLSTVGYLAFALNPTAKVLVIAVTFLGLSLGLHEFGYLDYYKSLIRQDKHVIARVILMRTFTSGSLIGAVVFGIANAFNSVRMPLLAIALIMLVISAAYPLLTLMDNSSSAKTGNRPSNRAPQRRGEG